MIILDSDIFTLLTYEHSNVVRHYEAVPADERLAVTAITRIEILRGRTDSVLKAASEQELLTATKRMQATAEALSDFLVVHVDEEVLRVWRKWLSRQRRRGLWPWARFNELLRRIPLPWPHAAPSPTVARL